jgi:hypothetical protein
MFVGHRPIGSIGIIYVHPVITSKSVFSKPDGLGKTEAKENLQTNTLEERRAKFNEKEFQQQQQQQQQK